MTARFRLLVIAGLLVAVAFVALAFRSGDEPPTTVSDTRSEPGQAVTPDPVSVCASSIPEEVVVLVRELRAQVICRAAASGQPGHVDTDNRRIVIEARPGLTPMAYADTALSLARQLDRHGRGQLS